MENIENKEQKFKEFIDKKQTVQIRGQEYSIRELSLAQKIKVLGHVSELINDVVKNIFIKKDGNGGIKIEIPDNLSAADLNIERILMNSINALPEILALSVPDFKDWDNLSESDTREPLLLAMKINDFAGFAANFISLAGNAIRLQRR